MAAKKESSSKQLPTGPAGDKKAALDRLRQGEACAAGASSEIRNR